MGCDYNYHSYCFQLKGFVETFDEKGPGAVGHDMDRGIKLMESYEVSFADMELQRQELGK